MIDISRPRELLLGPRPARASPSTRTSRPTGFLYLLYVHEANALNPTGPKTSRLTRIRVTSDNRLEDPEAPETVARSAPVAQAPCPGARRHRRLHPRRRLLARDRDRAGRPGRHAVARVRRRRELATGSTRPRCAPMTSSRSPASSCTSTATGGAARPSRSARGRPTSRRSAPSSTPRAFATPSASTCGPPPARSSATSAGKCCEELNVTRPGRSYGWPCYEGDGPDAGLRGPRGLRRTSTPSARRRMTHRRTTMPNGRGGRGDRGRSALRGRTVPGRVPRRLVLRRLREGPASGG